MSLYLESKSRNDLARPCGLGQGTVYNILDEWKCSLA